MPFVVCRLPLAVRTAATERRRGHACLKGTIPGPTQSRVDALNQSGQHLLYVARGRRQCFAVFLREKSQVSRQQKKVNKFVCRARGDVKKLAELRTASPRTAFRDVRWNRTGGSSHLIGQAVLFRSRERRSNAINPKGKIVALLPNFEIHKVLHRNIPQTWHCSGQRSANVYILGYVSYYKYCKIRQQTSGPDVKGNTPLTAHGERQTVREVFHVY